MSGEDAVTEFQEGLIANRGGGGGGGAEMDEERKRILEERERWENEKSEMRVQRDEDAYKRAMTAVDNQVTPLPGRSTIYTPLPGQPTTYTPLPGQPTIYAPPHNRIPPSPSH